MRAVALAPEVCLSGALAVSFASLVVAGPRAGRAARFALLFGCAAALVATVASRWYADAFLFRVYRIDPLSQLVKLAVLLGSLVAATTARGEDRWAAMRVTSPFFHLCTTLALVLMIGTVDLLVAPLAWWLAAISAILLASSVGRWSVLEKIVRRSLAGFLSVTAVALVGAVLAAAAGASTRLDALRDDDGVRAGALVLGLALWSAIPLWLMIAAPLQLRRLEDDPSGSRAAPVLGVTGLFAAGGLAVIRAFSLAYGPITEPHAMLLVGIVILPAFIAAARRFALSFGVRVPALATSVVSLTIAAWLIWPWLKAAVGELD